MRERLSYSFKAFIFFIAVFFSATRSHATHIFGIDLYYTHVTGNTYTIHLVVYGDCSGAAFGTLPSSVPVVNIYNGNTFISSVSLSLQAPTGGVEVTPVCPADVGLTTCTSLSYTIPGVKKFVFAANVTLSGASAVWRFLFQGVMGVSSAGRSSTITNISSPGSTVIQLVDTLNNVPASAHSNAVFSAIPTPFFCDNVPANYNPGAVPSAGDSISLSLVPGVDASTGVDVNYIFPYTATAPLATSPGTFSFTSATGQLAFTPNLLQRALVVYNVDEYNGGVFRGTCQREMTFVVLTCTSTPPFGSISGATAGTITSPTSIDICDNVGAYSFQINPTDAGGNHITMTVTGLPSGATFNIVGNGTLAPLGTFSWTTTGVAPGTYIFYITYQDDGCPLSGIQTIAYSIDVLPVPSETVSLVSPATCVKKAVFHVTPGGSASPWTIKVIQGGTTVQTITGVTGMITDSLAPGTYTIQTVNPSNCFADTVVTFAAPPLPVPRVTVTPPLCPGGATGVAVITATGGAPPYLYAIGSGTYSATDTFRSLTPGTDTLHVEDTNHCVKDTVITVPNATPILMNISVRSPLCDTFKNGMVIITAYNSTGPYTYAIGRGAFSSTDTFRNLGAGTDTFYVKNANGCIADTVLTLSDSLSIYGSLAIAPILCNLGTATVTVTATGGSALPYTYAYNTSPFGASDVFTLAAGTYTFHVHDPNSCYWDTTVTFTQPSPITATTVVTNVLCHGAATGSVVVTAAGGTPAYTYNVDGGTYGTSSTLTGLLAGSHIVNVEDANGCIYKDTITITQPPSVLIDSVKMVMPLCNGASNGSVTVYASGGVAPYTYAIGTGAFGMAATFTGLAAGTDTLYVKDANGCIKDTIVTLPQPASISITASVTPSLCHTLANGKVAITATGGTPGYTYAIGAGAYSAVSTFTPLAAGTDTFYVKDANGCIRDTIITIADSLHIYGVITISPALCFNQATGTISATGTGGTSPYVYAIGSGAYGTTSAFTSLLAGSYMVHTRDNNGCQDDTLVTVTQPSAMVPALSITEPACYGYSNGSVTIAATGGTPAYSYSWNNGPLSATTVFTGVTAGRDSIIITDAHGCRHDTVFTIQQPSKVDAGVRLKNISCFNGADGAVTVTGAGGTPSYVYAADSSAWQSSGAFSGFSAGAITIQVKDNNGCEFDTAVDLTQPAQLVIIGADTINPTCAGYKNGTVILYVAGGASPYAYSDDNTDFSSTNSFTALGAGSYTFAIKDGHGCMVDTSITLTGLPPILVDSIGLTKPTCYGAQNGSAVVVAGGGVPPFTYQLVGNTKPEPAGVFGNLYAGTYTIDITDSRNCIKDTSVLLPQPDSIAITATVVPNECKGDGNIGSIAISAAGGTQPYKYLWNTNPAQSTPAISNLPNGSYTVVVTDTNDCTGSFTSAIGYDNCCSPFIPNAFTPNGDGLNDYFKLYFKGDLYIIIFSVYNRFGQQVYSISNTSDPDPGWDGKFEGVNADMGTYYYYARIICGNKGNHIEELKGDVTLIR